MRNSSSSELEYLVVRIMTLRRKVQIILTFRGQCIVI